MSLSITALMGALAILLSLARIEIPFPILIYLKVDFAEIPSFITYYLLGLPWGLACATIHWIALIIRSGNPIGPTMKYLAVTSNLIGIFVASRAIAREGGSYIPGLVSGACVRVGAMSVANVILMYFLFPFYISGSRKLLEAAGIATSSKYEVLVWVLLIVGIYNALHSVVSAAPSIIVVKAVKRRLRALLG